MEAQLYIQLLMYFMLAFIVLSFPLKSEGSCDDNKDQHSIGSWTCSPEYISKSYFEKHSSLVDSDFQGFLSRELPLGSCKELPHLNSMVSVSTLRQKLIGEGSHRHLRSSIKFMVQAVTSNRPVNFCQAIVVEKLPSGVFADPFEIQHLVERGVFVDAAVFGDTDLELPSALCNRSIVEVHMDIGRNILFRPEKVLEVNIDLPLHARYPPLGESYSSVQMNMPDIFMRCSIEEEPKNINCLWMAVTESVVSGPDALVWKIPSGNEAHSRIVSAVTFTAALLSALLIILTTIYAPYNHVTENLKQS